MHLKLGDRLVDASGEYEVIGRPYMTNAGKDVHVRVCRADNRDVTMIRSWAAHERVAVKTNRRRVMEGSEAAAELWRLANAAKLIRLYRERTGQPLMDMDAFSRWVSANPEVKTLEPSREDIEAVERDHPQLARIARTGGNPHLFGKN
jgi:hypothetical protein